MRIFYYLFVLIFRRKTLNKDQIKNHMKDSAYKVKKDIYIQLMIEIKSSNDSNLTYKVRLAFVRNKNNKSEYLTLLCTDTNLDEKQIIKRYESR